MVNLLSKLPPPLAAGVLLVAIGMVFFLGCTWLRVGLRLRGVHFDWFGRVVLVERASAAIERDIKRLRRLMGWYLLCFVLAMTCGAWMHLQVEAEENSAPNNAKTD